MIDFKDKKKKVSNRKQFIGRYKSLSQPCICHKTTKQRQKSFFGECNLKVSSKIDSRINARDIMPAQKSSCSIYVIVERRRNKFRAKFLNRKLFSISRALIKIARHFHFSCCGFYFSVHDFYRSDAISADKCRRNLLAAFSKRCRRKFPLKSIELFFNCSNRAQLQMRKVPRRHAGHRLSSSPLANNSFIGHHAGEIYCF